MCFSEYRDGFRYKISTNTTNEIPNVMFIRCKVHITPNEQKNTYVKDVLGIKEEFIEKTRCILRKNANYENNYILNVEISEKSVCFNKKSHFHYDIFLKPKDRISLYRNKEILETMCGNINKMLAHLFLRNNFRIID